MIQYKKCACCGLELPLSVMQPIQIRHQGKPIVVGICNRCKELKQAEAQQNKPTVKAEPDIFNIGTGEITKGEKQ